jgi:hypothetical protein
LSNTIFSFSPREASAKVHRRQGPLDAQVEHLVVEVLHHGEHRGFVLRLVHLAVRVDVHPLDHGRRLLAAAAGIHLAAHVQHLVKGEDAVAVAVHRVETHLQLFFAGQLVQRFWLPSTRGDLSLERALRLRRRLLGFAPRALRDTLF